MNCNSGVATTDILAMRNSLTQFLAVSLDKLKSPLCLNMLGGSLPCFTRCWPGKPGNEGTLGASIGVPISRGECIRVSSEKDDALTWHA